MVLSTLRGPIYAAIKDSTGRTCDLIAQAGYTSLVLLILYEYGSEIKLCPISRREFAKHAGDPIPDIAVAYMPRCTAEAYRTASQFDANQDLIHEPFKKADPAPYVRVAPDSDAAPIRHKAAGGTI